MKKYEVMFSGFFKDYIKVEAQNETEAKEKALDILHSKDVYDLDQEDSDVTQLS